MWEETRILEKLHINMGTTENPSDSGPGKNLLLTLGVTANMNKAFVPLDSM